MIGIDAVIARLNRVFARRLFPDQVTRDDDNNIISDTRVFNGRAYPIEKDDIIKPGEYISATDYKDVLFDDVVSGVKTSMSLFYEVHDQDDDVSIYDSSVDIPVSIVIVGNLATLYPEATHRPVEEFLNEFKQCLLLVESVWELQSYRRGLKALGQYNHPDLKQSLGMHPLHILRLNMNVKYLLKNC